MAYPISWISFRVKIYVFISSVEILQFIVTLEFYHTVTNSLCHWTFGLLLIFKNYEILQT